MGLLFSFRCAGCGYEREVSGRPEVGMTSRTSTALCGCCRDLFDVVVSEKPWLKGSSKPLRTLPCPGCGRHELQRWTHPGACPKCGRRKLDREGPSVCWD